jgi:hypothetical protein
MLPLLLLACALASEALLNKTIKLLQQDMGKMMDEHQEDARKE